MDTEIQSGLTKFEIKVKGRSGQQVIIPITKKRSLIGRGQACDLVLPFSDISSIHAVIEVTSKNEIKIYDLNSKNGTFVSGQKVVVAQVNLDQEVFLGENSLVVTHYKKSDLPPPPLAILDETEAPKVPPVSPQNSVSIPYVKYPLAKDKNADSSEYIFEDADHLYPIFKYDMAKSSVEVIIVFNDRIQSVDYIPNEEGTYSLVGKRPRAKQINYPYLGKEEVFPFINIKNGEAEVFPLPGYETKSLDDSKRENLTQGFFLNPEEIVQFRKQHIQIFVRKTGAPPKVAAAPILRRDPELKKYLLLMLFLVFSFLVPFTVFEVDEEVEKEKAPERIATILYKRKLTVSETRAIEKTKDAPKVVQKSPKLSKSKPKDKAQEEVKKDKQAKPKTVKAKGIKTAKKTGQVKKASPNKGPRNVKKDRVTPTRPKKASSARGSQSPKKAAAAIAPSKGAVDTYRSADFKSTVSSLISKGGSTKSAKVLADSSSGYTGASVSQAATGATLKTAKVSNNTGALSGVTSGKLDSSKGVEGLVSKDQIFTAGLPYKTVILGGLDPDVIRRILVENIPRFRYCYQKELDSAKRAFNGVVKLNFIIGASGHVTKAGVEGNSSLPGSVRGCVVNVLRRIKFPSPMGGGVVEVGQPMNFYPKVK